jgi:hypothetical protein
VMPATNPPKQVSSSSSSICLTMNVLPRRRSRRLQQRGTGTCVPSASDSSQEAGNSRLWESVVGQARFRAKAKSFGRNSPARPSATITSHTEHKKERAKNNVIPIQATPAQQSDGAANKQGRASRRLAGPHPKGAATRLPLSREPMALDHRYEPARAAGWQAIFLGTTEPRAARPEKPAARTTPVSQAPLAVSTIGKKCLH